jgi:hypothetical protein
MSDNEILEIEETSSEEEIEIKEESEEEELEIEIEETSSEEEEEVEIEEEEEVEIEEEEEVEIEIEETKDDDLKNEEDNNTYLEYSGDSSSLSKELKSLGEIVIKGEKFKRYELAVNDNVPVNFVVKNKDQIINLEKKFDKKENITFNYNKFLNMGIKLQAYNFLLLYYIVNKDKPTEVLIENFNKLNEIIGLEKFYEKNIVDYKYSFQQKYDFLLEKTKEDFKNFRNFYKKIENFETLENYDDVINTFSVDATQVEYNIKDGDYLFDIENMKIIFNDIETNNFFSYIRLDGKDNSSYKIFTGGEKKYENFLDLNDTVPFENYKMYIYYEFNLGAKYVMDYVKIDLLESKCRINFLGDTLELIKKKLVELIPGIQFLKETEKNIIGDFEIVINNYDETKLYYLTLFSDIFSEFIFIKEDISLRSLKENIKFYYVGTDQYREYLNYSIYFNIKKLQNNRYLIIFTSKSSSPSLIKEFILILMKLFWYYDNLESKELKFFSVVTEPYTGVNGKGLGSSEENMEELLETKKTKKIENLMSADKDLFQKRLYVRSCPCPKQPIIISQDDIEDWEDYELNGKKRNVILFPPQDSTQKAPKNYYVCPDDEFTTLSLKENPDQSSKYPLIPCCSISNFPENLYNDYEKIRKNPSEYWSDKELYRGKNKNILKTLKILNSGRLGVVPDYITSFLNKIETDNYIREGVYKSSTSSFLHCIARSYEYTNFIIKNKKRNNFQKRALEFSKIYNKSSISRRNLIVKKFRILMGNFSSDIINLNVARQELYDFKISEVFKLVSDTNYNLNSNKFFRYFEAFFILNIFVFVYDKDLDKTYLEIPNYQYYHIRIVNENLPCIFIIKHIRKYSFDVYEIIRKKEAKNPYVYDKKFSLFMKNYIENKQTYYIKTKNTILKNPFNIAWEKILKDYKIVSQMINSSGRTFSISFEYNKSGDKISLFTQSGAPLNCENTTDMYYVTKKIAISLFGNNYLLGSEGLWYPINGIELGFFIPCTDIDEREVNTCKNYKIIKDKDVKIWELDNIKICKKNSNIFIQLIRWLYFLEDVEIAEWFNLFCVKEEKQSKDSLVSRTFSLPLRFPQNISDTSSGISYLNKYIPDIFDKKIFMYEELYEATLKNLINFKRVNNDLNIINAKVLNNTLNYEEDYSQYEFNKLLLGNNFNIWKEDVLKLNNDIYRIEEDYICQKTPFIWKNKENGKIYLIQNNISNSLIISLMCCKSNQYFGSSFTYGYNLNNFWKIIKRKYKSYNFSWTFDKLKDYILRMTDKKLYFQDSEACLDYLEKNHIPFKMEEEYSYLVYSKKGDKIYITNKYIIDDKHPLEVFMYAEGGYAAMIPIV